VDTVQQAVVVLGTTRIRHLALAAAVFGVFRGIPSHLVDVRSFWEHSLAVALCAELIGKRVGHPTETLFVSGLLHDLGLLVICANQPAEALKVLHAARAERTTAPPVERRLLGYDHGEVGEQLLAAWGLPIHAEPARFHHAPSLRPSFPTDVVHLANVVVTELRLGSTGEPVPYTLDERAWRRLGLRVPDLDGVMAELIGKVKVVEAEYLA
jgi:HD-like signal output (HDOD) protein